MPKALVAEKVSVSPRGCAEPPNFTWRLLEPSGVTVMPAGALPTSLNSVSGPPEVTETVAVAGCADRRAEAVWAGEEGQAGDPEGDLLAVFVEHLQHVRHIAGTGCRVTVWTIPWLYRQGTTVCRCRCAEPETSRRVAMPSSDCLSQSR